NHYSGTSGLLGNAPVELNFISLTPKADNNQLYQLKLGIASRDPRLTSGMNLIVSVSNDASVPADSVAVTAFEVPLRSVFNNDGVTSVWVFNPSDSTVHATPVTVAGDGAKGTVTVVSGLSHGNEIVSGGVHSLVDGERVKVIEQSSSTNRGGLL
nr:efflux RND transporter periplasmic adaptor subunit [Muribaculaceae bacterium]